jgi:hypothetical protein
MKKSKFTNTTQLPDHEIESLARCFLPYIREYYETEEGRKAYDAWKRAQESKKTTTG